MSKKHILWKKLKEWSFVLTQGSTVDLTSLFWLFDVWCFLHRRQKNTSPSIYTGPNIAVCWQKDVVLFPSQLWWNFSLFLSTLILLCSSVVMSVQFLCMQSMWTFEKGKSGNRSLQSGHDQTFFLSGFEILQRGCVDDSASGCGCFDLVYNVVNKTTFVLLSQTSSWPVKTNYVNMIKSTGKLLYLTWKSCYDSQYLLKKVNFY